MVKACVELWPAESRQVESGVSAQLIFEPKDKAYEQKKSSYLRHDCGCGADGF